MKKVLVLLLHLFTFAKFQALIASLNVKFPGDTYNIGAMAIGSVISGSFYWTLGDGATLTLKLAKNNVLVTQWATAAMSLNFSYSVTTAGNYTVRMFNSIPKPIPYTLIITANGATNTYNNTAVSSTF